uniref:G-protein coupled receptors family 1 profile domain-containing protein n=1 Tax=Theropithecus gelada TaxID=9565 RepID=A0A8D2G0C8_THEGE
FFYFKSTYIYTEPENLTGVLEFLLLGLPDDLELQPILAGLFLSMYLVTVLGNLLIILAVGSDSHLHTPIYFFLSNLSLADIGFASTTVPKMLMNIQAHSRLIFYVGCLIQMSFSILFAFIMNPRLCGFLVLVSFLLSLLDSQLHNLIVLQLTCFNDVEISKFFCDPSQLLNLACSDTSINNMVVYFIGTIFGFLPLSGILFSYYKIVFSIPRVRSSGTKYKAFSTCSSHLSVVCLFYGTALGGYLSSAVSLPPRKGAAASVMYMVVTPMLNPFIYSVRNRYIQSALWRLQGRIM